MVTGIDRTFEFIVTTMKDGNLEKTLRETPAVLDAFRIILNEIETVHHHLQHANKVKSSSTKIMGYYDMTEDPAKPEVMSLQRRGVCKILRYSTGRIVRGQQLR